MSTDRLVQESEVERIVRHCCVKSGTPVNVLGAILHEIRSLPPVPPPAGISREAVLDALAETRSAGLLGEEWPKLVTRIEGLPESKPAGIEREAPVYKDFEVTRMLIADDAMLWLTGVEAPISGKDLAIAVRSVATLRAALVRARTLLNGIEGEARGHEHAQEIAADLKAIDDALKHGDNSHQGEGSARPTTENVDQVTRQGSAASEVHEGMCESPKSRTETCDVGESSPPRAVSLDDVLGELAKTRCAGLLGDEWPKLRERIKALFDPRATDDELRVLKEKAKLVDEVGIRFGDDVASYGSWWNRWLARYRAIEKRT